MKNKNYFFLSIGNFSFDILMSKRMYQLETVSRFLDLRNKKSVSIGNTFMMHYFNTLFLCD
jgi:hypothetical protein